MKSLRWTIAVAICMGCLAIPSTGLAASSGLGTTTAESTSPAATAPATIDGMAASTLVTTIGDAATEVAVAKAPALPKTATEASRLTWLAAGHIDQMTLYDATIAAEIARGPWTVTSDTTTVTSDAPTMTSAGSAFSVAATPDVNVGTCYEGNQNQKVYSEGIFGSVTVDSGITGYCDGPGGNAIVARGDYEGGINLDYPDACNAAPTPHFHIQNSNYYGANPQRIDMLNTANDGDSLPGGACLGESEYASADWVNYQGSYGPWNYIGGGWGQPGWGSDNLIGGPYTCCSNVTNN
jgi:hypothetical protein